MVNNIDPVKEAEALLEATWPPGRIPVDPVSIAAKIGVRVLVAELPDDVSGAIIKRPGQDPRILIEGRDSENRRRFTVAHELGHFIHRSAENGGDDYDYIDFRGAQQSEEEIFANKFAANLLMPAAIVKTLHNELNGALIAMAARFGVSWDAMSFRLKNLGLRQQQG